MIHPTACIDASINVPDDCVIGAFCVIERGVRLGQRVRIGEHAVIKSGTVLGDDVEVHAGVVLGRNLISKAALSSAIERFCAKA